MHFVEGSFTAETEYSIDNIREDRPCANGCRSDRLKRTNGGDISHSG
jgi:hypothetical protein